MTSKNKTKMEDDLKKTKTKKNDLNKMEDKPINQIQPNWL